MRSMEWRWTLVVYLMGLIMGLGIGWSTSASLIGGRRWLFLGVLFVTGLAWPLVRDGERDPRPLDEP
ncbi:hypothetical protein [Mobilicoccus pelagius]|uniref:Uncharacterized protein n=1 Tax=Mobilicoccus pelagius NBRC 104925 TaxID=1089455 RepID=H5UMD6_9MICO|nr:hypothetical protein [Mobilicoccus pelagius]GAB46894.1 hypothetical protein MOPEL_001_00120 [Mobilicoccus pelagius NBRC 104925]